MQKFIKGSPDDGLSPLPLTIGMTATPQKFNALVSGITSSTMHQVVVPPEDVRSSGLLKDRIILRYPTLGFDADMSLFKASVEDWKKKCALWQAYYDQNKDGDHHDLVKPILVVQVTDGSGKEATGTDLTQCLDIWEEVTGSRLLENEVVHTFNDYGTLSGGELRAEVLANYFRHERLPDCTFLPENALYQRTYGTLPEGGVIIQQSHKRSQAARSFAA